MRFCRFCVTVAYRSCWCCVSWQYALYCTRRSLRRSIFQSAPLAWITFTFRRQCLSSPGAIFDHWEQRISAWHKFNMKLDIEKRRKIYNRSKLTDLHIRFKKFSYIYIYFNKFAQNFEHRSRRTPVTSYTRNSISSGSLKLNSSRERYDSHRNPDDAE